MSATWEMVELVPFPPSIPYHKACANQYARKTCSIFLIVFLSGAVLPVVASSIMQIKDARP
eukprot:SAG31_NODE_545_length_14238_cov_15.518849_11_plen_61_part_00